MTHPAIGFGLQHVELSVVALFGITNMEPDILKIAECIRRVECASPTDYGPSMTADKYLNMSVYRLFSSLVELHDINELDLFGSKENMKYMLRYFRSIVYLLPEVQQTYQHLKLARTN